ncbi:MAG: hypothetical protein J6B57_02530 [Oscillospiraceae bacterium]|nr:hypothetical protein [Oscillospiraceae bacterium]
MLEKQINALTTILRDKDIRNYSGDLFYNIIKAVALGDVGALLDAAGDVKNIIFHTPTVLFWDKMQRYLFGTFKCFDDQVKMSEKFTKNNSCYESFVKKQINLVNEMNDDKKIDYFASLTRCFLLNEMENDLYYKLARFINMCTSDELDYIRDFDYNNRSKINAVISSLYQYGLFEQSESNDGTDYVLSGFAKALKNNCLNYDEGLNSRDRILSYDQIPPLNIAEPTSFKKIDEMF